MLRIIINEKYIEVKPNKLILIILTGLLLSLIIGCGYTVVKKSSKTSEYTNTQQDYNYKLNGLCDMVLVFVIVFLIFPGIIM
jgi:hypothetical protein